MQSSRASEAKRATNPVGRLAIFFALVLFVVALAVYVRTLAPSITWKNTGSDSGDFVSAAITSGIPHPPGYPLYMALAQACIALPIGGIAYRVNLLSALAAAGAVVVFYFLLLLILPAGGRWRTGAALSAAALFAFSPLFWSQATIAEVIALGALLTATVLVGLVLWSDEAETGKGEKQSSWRVYGRWIVAVALGLGLAHHPTIVFMIPAGVVLLFGRVRFRQVLLTLVFACALAGVISLSLFVRAWNDPGVNWGDPRTPANWWWLVSGQLYHGYLFSLEWGGYPERFSAWAKLLFDQFGIIGVALGIWGALDLYRCSHRIGAALGTTFVVFTIFAIGYNSFDSDVYLIPAFMAFACSIACALCHIASELIDRLHETRIARVIPVAIALIWVVLPFASLVSNFARIDLSGDTEALDYARQAFAVLPDHSLVVADGDEHVFALVYYRYAEQPQSHVMILAPGLLGYAWYQDELRRHNADWLWPEGSGQSWEQFLSQLVARNMDRHAIFWTSRDPQIEQYYVFREIGPLYQVETAASSSAANDLWPQVASDR